MEKYMIKKQMGSDSGGPTKKIMPLQLLKWLFLLINRLSCKERQIGLIRLHHYEIAS